MQDDLIPFIPFEKLRGRTLVWCYFLTMFLCGIIHFELRRIGSENGVNPLPDAIISIAFYVIFFICISPILYRSQLSYKQLFGVFPKFYTIRKYILWTIPLILFSLLAFFLQYIPLHYLLPDLADWMFLDRDISLSMPHDREYLLENILYFITLVLLAPIVEEFFVRGILLTRWSIKWGISKAVLASSLLFGILHTNILGAVFFGFVMSVLYIRTESLYIPIFVHMFNNFIVWIVGLVDKPMEELAQEQTPIELELSDIIFLIVVCVLIIPWAINLVRKNLPKNSWRVPYLIEARFLK